MAKHEFSDADMVAAHRRWTLPQHERQGSFHGPRHWTKVLNNALWLREKECLPESYDHILYLAALFHDSKRVNEGNDPGHGGRAAVSLLGCRSVCAETIMAAQCCAFHTEVVPWLPMTSDLSDEARTLVQLFADADRLDIGRLGRVIDTRFLFTDSAIELVELCRYQQDGKAYQGGRPE